MGFFFVHGNTISQMSPSPLDGIAFYFSLPRLSPFRTAIAFPITHSFPSTHRMSEGGRLCLTTLPFRPFLVARLT